MDKRRIFFFDEARFGTHSNLGHGWFHKGSRTPVNVKLGFQNFYLYSAVDPKLGQDFSLVLPNVNSNCMNLFLKEFSAHTKDEQVIMVIDGAGWHHSRSLQVPPNIEIVYLPPYSPELNPVERLWLYIKQKIIKNRIYDTIEELEDVLCEFMTQNLNQEILMSICSVNYL